MAEEVSTGSKGEALPPELVDGISSEVGPLGFHFAAITLELLAKELDGCDPKSKSRLTQYGAQHALQHASERARQYAKWLHELAEQQAQAQS